MAFFEIDYWLNFTMTLVYENNHSESSTGELTRNVFKRELLIVNIVRAAGV